MEVLIERLDYFGRGIGYIDKKICFVPNALPDELVEVEITDEKHSYLEAKVINYIKKSKDRVEAPCPYYDKCGGCQLQHISLEKENEFKTNKVKDLVQRLGNIDPTIVEDCLSVNEYNYRNKVTLHTNYKTLGYYQEKTKKVVKIDKCLILREELNDKIESIKKIVDETNRNINYISEALLRVANKNKNVILKLRGGFPEDDFKSQFYGFYNTNGINYGKKLISEIGDCNFYVSPDSFFQVNGDMTKVLYDEVLNYCKKNKVRSVLDLYCGAGTISIYISKYVKGVLGIDISESSIKDAKRNMNLNKVRNTKFICSRMEDYIENINSKYDLAIVDPPRAGLDNKTINHLLKLKIKTIIYISCDPSTLARDLNILNDNYNIERIKVFNMFPRTYHVETLSILKLKA